MSATQFPIEKLPNAELLRIAQQGSDLPVSVLIELSLPPRRVELSAVNRQEDINPRHCRAIPDTPEYTEEISRRSDATMKFLTSLLSEPPIWLEASRAFVARANGKQLQSIACFPMIKAIHPNKRLAAHV